MPTNKIKHEMLKAAKRVANTEFESKRTVHRGLDGNISSESWYPATYFMNLEIRSILEKHPEFDEDKFREMVRDFIKTPAKEEEN
jgi:hypothetical protein